MSIRVEFFGIPRRRAGVSETILDLAGDTIRLGEVLAALGQRYPALNNDCLSGERLQTAVAANLSGRGFLTDPDVSLQAGDSLLLLSADGGG